MDVLHCFAASVFLLGAAAERTCFRTPYGPSCTGISLRSAEDQLRPKALGSSLYRRQVGFTHEQGKAAGELPLEEEYHLAPVGADKCVSGQPASNSVCQAIGTKLALASGHTPGRYGWAGYHHMLPSGCSIQTGGDYTPHYNHRANSQNDGAYTLICSGKAPETPTYHLAPIGSQKCDSGQSLPQEWCQAIGTELVKAMGDTPGRRIWSGSYWPLPAGCSIQIHGDKTPHFNRHPSGNPQGHAHYALVCSGPSPPPVPYHLAPMGASKCDFGTSASAEWCQEVATAIAKFKGKQPKRLRWVGRYHTLPTGCSLQSGGDWTPHFNTHPNPHTTAGYQMVCTGAGDGTPPKSDGSTFTTTTTTTTTIDWDYHLASKGEPSCDWGHAPSKADCFAIAAFVLKKLGRKAGGWLTLHHHRFPEKCSVHTPDDVVVWNSRVGNWPDYANFRHVCSGRDVEVKVPAEWPVASPAQLTNARLLIQSTFGPTRHELKDLESKTHLNWVKAQVALPVEEHRAFFRKRVNPRGNGRPPCTAGSRWHNFAFSWNDYLRFVEVGKDSNGEITLSVDGGFRTNVPKTSDWATQVGKHLQICMLQQGVKNWVRVMSEKCQHPIRSGTHFSNPQVWLADETSTIAVTLEMVLPFIGGTGANHSGQVGILAETLDPCPFSNDPAALKRPLVKADGKFFTFDPRIELLENTLENPSRLLQGGVRDVVNENYCKLPDHPHISTPGATVKILDPQRRIKAEFVDATGETLLTNTLREYSHFFYVSWTGMLSITKDGTYHFSIGAGNSDFSMRINLQEIISFKRPAKSGTKSVVLPAGSHMISLDLWQRSRYFAGAEINWQGPDTGGILTPLIMSRLTTRKRHWAGSTLACGSPGEAANDPKLGDFLQWGWGTRDFDGHIFSPDGVWTPPASGSVWVMKALAGADQLRLRMAWALSQIFVINTGGINQGETELYLMYYDIFTRHGLGNYRDVVKEVTFSSMMGRFLTHEGSTSFDYDGTDANENYPRELMQLFTLGVNILQEDGSELLDKPTYEQDDVLSFARILTGFTMQDLGIQASNKEWTKHGGFRLMFPMYLDSRKRDKYPKRDLNDDYIGDRLPLCSDSSSSRAFLAKGARYEMQEVQFNPELVHQLDKDSALYKHICAAPGSGPCASKFWTELDEELDCTGKECLAEHFKNVSFVQVGDQVFRFVLPRCVRTFFGTGAGQVARIDDFGNVVQAGGNNPFSVDWGTDGFKAAKGEYAIEVAEESVFSILPTKEDIVGAGLKVRAFPPFGSCNSCAGDVKVFHGPGEGFTSDTVFKVDGEYYKNAKEVVRLAENAGVFRNPPVFDQKGRGGYDEVDELLDHIIRHPNCATFVGLRLIQRFGTSAPSKAYIIAVRNAFLTGHFNEVSFTEKPKIGDLAATVAAILLHPDSASHDEQARGALREPLLKFVHIMRSMEYKDRIDDVIAIQNLQGAIGQFLFHSPTVFNFFHATFDFPKSDLSPEAHFDGAQEELIPAPELEIHTPEFMVGFINTVKDLVDISCTSGSPIWLHTRGIGNPPHKWTTYCPVASLSWQAQDIIHADALVELDLLLTGGRMSPLEKEVLLRSSTAMPMQRFTKDALKIISMTAAFNSFGKPKPLATRREWPSAAESKPTNLSPYKAIVMLFLAGGADTFNMLVPLCDDKYKEYTEIRKMSALPTGSLLKIEAQEQELCPHFGIAESFSFVKEQYVLGEAAFYSNVGNMKAPHGAGVGQCHQFSHAHAVNGFETGRCQQFGNADGQGGRIADSLADKYATSSISIGSASTWSKGWKVARQAISANHLPRLHEYAKWKAVVHNISGEMHGNLYADAFNMNLQKGIQTTEHFRALIDSAKLATTQEWKGSVGYQLQTIAKLMATRKARGVEREIFFCSHGGYDMHGGLGPLPAKYKAVDDALRDFVEEMKKQKEGNDPLWDHVVFFTASEFGRALYPTSGGGTNHGWAGNHFVMGGKVRGRRIFNKFPKSLGSSAHGGRLAPDFPWESIMVPLAQWMGMPEASTSKVFPNYHMFNSSRDIVTKDSLFVQ